jgi:hypothetical protein
MRVSRFFVVFVFILLAACGNSSDILQLETESDGLIAEILNLM